MGAMIDDPKTVGKRLKNLREALGFTSQVAFAKELGIKRSSQDANFSVDLFANRELPCFP